MVTSNPFLTLSQLKSSISVLSFAPLCYEVLSGNNWTRKIIKKEIKWLQTYLDIGSGHGEKRIRTRLSSLRGQIWIQ